MADSCDATRGTRRTGAGAISQNLDRRRSVVTTPRRGPCRDARNAPNTGAPRLPERERRRTVAMPPDGDVTDDDHRSYGGVGFVRSRRPVPAVRTGARPRPGPCGDVGRRAWRLAGRQLRGGACRPQRVAALQGHARGLGNGLRRRGRRVTRTGLRPPHVDGRPTRSHPAAAARLSRLFGAARRGVARPDPGHHGRPARRHRTARARQPDRPRCNLRLPIAFHGHLRTPRRTPSRPCLARRGVHQAARPHFHSGRVCGGQGGLGRRRRHVESTRRGQAGRPRRRPRLGSHPRP